MGGLKCCSAAHCTSITRAAEEVTAAPPIFSIVYRATGSALFLNDSTNGVFEATEQVRMEVSRLR